MGIKSLDVTVDIRWMQDLSNEDVGKVTRGEGEICYCPNCKHRIWYPCRDVYVRKNDQTPFVRRCGRCRHNIQFVVFHEFTDVGERTFLFAAPYKSVRKRKK